MLPEVYPRALLSSPRLRRRLYRINERWRSFARRAYLTDQGERLEKLGSSYGGWVTAVERIRPDDVIYAAGAGEDISFDLTLIERFGVHVHTFDPTPRAIRHVHEVASKNPKLHFQPVGLWSSDTRLRLWAPTDPCHVSHSALNLQATDRFFDAEVRTLSTLMASNRHSHVDLLKLDIEGAEYEVLDHMLTAALDVRALAVEFDQPVPFWRTDAMVRRLLAAGYALVDIDGWNFLFLRPSHGREARG